jgi:spore maturation protein CgeB
MELFLKDGVEYFSSIEEAREKIDHFLIVEEERREIARRGLQIGRNFTSKQRVIELMILAERFIKTKGVGWKI